MDYGLKGLWIGQVIGIWLQSSLYAALCVQADWQSVADDATERLIEEK